MEKYVASIQDKLRKIGFPRYDPEHIQQINFVPEPVSERVLRWNFVSRDKTEGVLLTENFIVYETTKYDVFETFAEQCAKVLTILNDIAEVDFATQIGLRYVDVIRELDGHPLNWFIRNEFHGLLPAAVDGWHVSNQFFTLIKTDEGTLKLKSIDGQGPNFMPSDLESNRLAFDLVLQEQDRFRILDFDHIWKGDIDFEPTVIVEKMRDLHAPIGKVFRATVSDEAIHVWMKKESTE